MSQHAAAAEHAPPFGATLSGKLGLAGGNRLAQQRGVPILLQVREGGQRRDGQGGLFGQRALAPEEAFGTPKGQDSSDPRWEADETGPAMVLGDQARRDALVSV